MGKVELPNEIMLGEVTRLLNEGREVVITPKGISMLPFIRGEVDSVRLRKPAMLVVGDIVLAHFNGQYVLHRIYALDGDRVTLMGDGKLRGIEQVLLTDIVGIVDDIITPEGRHRKPHKAWLWRHTIGIRKYLLKVYKRWNKLKNR